MTRKEILNTLPNLAGIQDKPFVIEIDRKYLPPNVKPVKNFYRFDRNKLRRLTINDRHNKSNEENNDNTNHSNGNFYPQQQQSNRCETMTTNFNGTSNGYSYGSQVNPSSYNYQQNMSFNNSPFAQNTLWHGQFINFMTGIIGTVMRQSQSWTQEQQYSTTYCQNLQIYQQTPRFPFSQQNRFPPYSAFNSFYHPVLNNHYYNRRQSSIFPRGKGLFVFFSIYFRFIKFQRFFFV